jgi:FAD/FMN-containing dehydrogenase
MFRAIKQTGDKYHLDIGLTAYCGNGILFPFVLDAKDNDVLNMINDLKQEALSLGGLFLPEVTSLNIRKNAAIWPHSKSEKLMKRLKTAVDPNSILNPGRVIL